MIKNKLPVSWRTNVPMIGLGAIKWKNYVDWGKMLNPSVDWDPHYQVVFHEFHKRPVLDEWQVKNPTGCGCLPLLPRAITCACTWGGW